MMVYEGGGQENNGRWITEQGDDGEMGSWTVGVQKTSKIKKKNMRDKRIPRPRQRNHQPCLSWTCTYFPQL